METRIVVLPFVRYTGRYDRSLASLARQLCNVCTFPTEVSDQRLSQTGSESIPWVSVVETPRLFPSTVHATGALSTQVCCADSMQLV